MNSSASTAQIVTDYEVNGASVEDIAETHEVEIESIKAILLANSLVYREATQVKEDITKEEYATILQSYKAIALCAESETVRERALRNLINEGKGRNDLKAKTRNIARNTTVNVNILNASMKKARQSLKNTLGSDINLEDLEKQLLLK